MIPDAFIQHRIGNRRVRLKIPSRKGDRGYFERIKQGVDKFSSYDRREINPLTGSMLIEDEGLDLSAFGQYAKKKRLFLLIEEKPSPKPFALQASEPIQAVSRHVRNVTGGNLDMPGAVFILLLLSGLIEIARGNFRSPPWYTAFWYAFGVFSKGLLDRTDTG